MISIYAWYHNYKLLLQNVKQQRKKIQVINFILVATDLIFAHWSLSIYYIVCITDQCFNITIYNFEFRTTLLGHSRARNLTWRARKFCTPIGLQNTYLKSSPSHIIAFLLSCWWCFVFLKISMKNTVHYTVL